MKSSRIPRSKHFIYIFTTLTILSTCAGIGCFSAFAPQAFGKPQFFQVKAPETDKQVEAGRQLFQAGQYAAATEQFGQALVEQFSIVEKENPNSVETLFNLGTALREKGETDKAKEKFAQILLLKPRPDDTKLSFTYLELGRCLLQKNDKNNLRSAVGLEKLAIKCLPTNHWAYLALSEALEKEGNETEALEALRQAVQINPKAPESRAALTRLLAGKAAKQRQKLTVR